MVTNEMKELLKKIADLAYQASDEVYDDDNENGTAGILNLCDKLYEKIDEYLENENREDPDDNDNENHLSAENGDYPPSCPWNAPGMSVKDFI